MRFLLKRAILPAVWGLMVSTALAQEAPPTPPPGSPPPARPENLPPPEVLPPGGIVQGAGHGPHFLGCAAGCSHGCVLETMKVHLIEEQHATTRPRLIIQEQVVGHTMQDKLVVEYKEERQIVTEMKLMPREEIQEVMATKVVEVPCLDDHGKPIVKYETVPCVRQVKVVRYEVVPVPREVIVRVPCVKHVPELMEIRKLCPYETEEAAICTKLRAEFQHNKVDVPPCPTPPAPVHPPVHHHPH